jgi:hypothetical protein
MLPQLESLELLDCPLKLVRNLESIQRPFESLEVLTMKGDLLVNNSYFEFVQGMKSLTSFTVSNFVSVKQSLFVEFFHEICINNGASLNELNVLQGAAYNAINDSLLNTIVAACPHLTALRLEKCHY